MVTYSRPTNDLALLLVSSVAADLRRQYSESMLDLYWETMTEMCRNLGVDIEDSLNYNRQKLGEDYRRAQLLALLLCIGWLKNPKIELQLQNFVFRFCGFGFRKRANGRTLDRAFERFAQRKAFKRECLRIGKTKMKTLTKEILSDTML